MSNKTKPPVSLEDIRPLCKKLHLSRMMERLEEQFADPSIQELPPGVCRFLCLARVYG